MGNAVFEIRQRWVRGGIELQGISKSDRGTKYIADSIVVLTPEGAKLPQQELIQAAIEKLTGRSEHFEVVLVG